MTVSQPDSSREPPSRVQRVRASSALDDLIHGDSPWFSMPLSQQCALREALLEDAYTDQLARCEPYAAFARRQLGASGPGSARDIPVISTGVFKYTTVQSVPAEQVEERYESSGTSGVKSVVVRDRVSLERLLGSVRGALALFEDWHEDELAIVNLGPGRQDVRSAWFQYVMSLIELLYPTESAVRAGVLDLGYAVETLLALSERYRAVALVGPPFLVADFCAVLPRHARGRRLACDDISVLTAGGWKRRSANALQRPDFDALVCTSLNLPDASRVRDAFNQVELNTVFLECAGREKHVPPWVLPIARCPETARPLADGQVGLLSYLDASAHSYPGFILAEDVGRVLSGRCTCGRDAVRVEVLRRCSARTPKGCALSMELSYAER